MKSRFLASVSGLTVVLVVALPAPRPAAGQDRVPGPTVTPSAAANRWTPPRTPDGQPDLQGVWLNNSATPLERPKALEGRQSLTDDEVAELKRRADRLFKDGNADLPVGDNLFLAALANPEQYRNPNGANRSSACMVEREFDRLPRGFRGWAASAAIPNACHEGNNDAMTTILAIARAEEQKARQR